MLQYPNSLQIFYYAASFKKPKAGLDDSKDNLILKLVCSLISKWKRST